jgi:hypothetical protein
MQRPWQRAHPLRRHPARTHVPAWRPVHTPGAGRDRGRDPELAVIESVTAVTIEPPDPEGPPRDADIRIVVTEGPTQQAEFWAGYGTEEELSGEMTWRHNNLGGGARSLAVSARWSWLDRGVHDAAARRPGRAASTTLSDRLIPAGYRVDLN